MYKLPVYIATLIFFHCVATSQPYYYKGEVKDEQGSLLQNVAILHNNSGYVYYSGQGGSFGLVLQKAKDTLTFSMAGYYKQKLIIDPTKYTTVILKKQPKLSASPYKLSSLTENLRRETQQQWFVGDETYASIIENQFVPARHHPSTGVSLNVDRASYSNIRRFINMQTLVPPDAVRIEEMLNYFNFNYSEPAAGKTFEISSVVTDCPWNAANQLMFAQISSRKIAIDSLPAANFVFLIDVSGSMDMPNRLPLLKASFRGLVNNLRQKDLVSIVVYGGTVGIMLQATSGADKDKIFAVIDSLTPGGNTPGESGIKLAYNLARKHFIEKGNNRVILATDGDFNVGLRSEADLEKLIEEQSSTGVYLTCLGVGMGNYKDSKIQVLAKKGRGNFAYLDSYAEGEKVMMKEFMQTLYVVADDAYLHVQFDPEQVKEYRLIGFDNKMGAIKDTLALIEGGSIGSAYSMIVTFEITPNNTAAAKIGSASLARFSLSYKVPSEAYTRSEVIQPQLNYTPLNKLERSYQFATSVMMFGSILKESRIAKNISFNDVSLLAAQSANMELPSQKEFLSLVQQAKSIYSKKKKIGLGQIGFRN